MSYEHVDCVVIGAGVIGLAIAREFAVQKKSVLVIEKEQFIASETSSRNSEVIHAGIYYPKNSLKAQLCVQGKVLLYEYLSKRNIAHKNCGKLIVATTENQLDDLQSIDEKAKENGVFDLMHLSAKEAHEKEPALKCLRALYSPSTGILNAHEYFLSLLGEIEDNNGLCVLNTEVVSIEKTNGHFEVATRSHGDYYTIKSDILINAAGLHATRIAKSTQVLDGKYIPETLYAKGNYFSLTGRSPFNHLVYPVPEKNGLGIHLTLDMQGTARFGPDVEWTKTINYQVDELRAELFYNEIVKYWSEINIKNLKPGYAGIRPKIYFSEEEKKAPQDFVIQTKNTHKIEGLINLFGIESPGLTSSLAIAKHVYASL